MVLFKRLGSGIAWQSPNSYSPELKDKSSKSLWLSHNRVKTDGTTRRHK